MIETVIDRGGLHGTVNLVGEGDEIYSAEEGSLSRTAWPSTWQTAIQSRKRPDW